MHLRHQRIHLGACMTVRHISDDMSKRINTVSISNFFKKRPKHSDEFVIALQTLKHVLGNEIFYLEISH